MIILRNSYYSSPYYGGGYDDLEERLFGVPLNSGLIGKTFKTTSRPIPKAWTKKIREAAKNGTSDLNKHINEKFPDYYVSPGGQHFGWKRLDKILGY